MADTRCDTQNPGRAFSNLGPGTRVYRFMTTGQFHAHCGVKPTYPPVWVKRIPDCNCQSKPGPRYGRMITFASFSMDAATFWGSKNGSRGRGVQWRTIAGS